jgi:hypothetical protein
LQEIILENGKCCPNIQSNNNFDPELQQRCVVIKIESVHTHETSGICLAGPNLAINKNMALHQDGNNFSVC